MGHRKQSRKRNVVSGKKNNRDINCTQRKNGSRIVVLVLGDIGRSPRMQYHALSLAKNGNFVDFIGYPGTTPMREILDLPNININHINPLSLPASGPKVLFYLLAPLKIMYLMLNMLWTLLVVLQSPDFILVQNPPAIPTLPIAQIASYLTGARLIIDWHNYGYTILGTRLGMSHPLVKVAKWCEQKFGRSAYAHLCVTEAMSLDLINEWGIRGKVIVLHDKAPKHFKRLSVSECHQLWIRLQKDSQFRELRNNDELSQENASTPFTACDSDGKVYIRQERPALLVSSTSWTADEDFSILIDALSFYDEITKQSTSPRCLLPRLVVVITGKGPLREFYEQRISEKQWSSVIIITAWLSAEDYPLLLGSADLGVSLHTSSSGLDLPMKVVDMLGCGTPVCAFNFSCLHELVNNTNGMSFKDAEELSQQIQMLVTGKTHENDAYQKLLRGAAAFHATNWDKNYAKVLAII